MIDTAGEMGDAVVALGGAAAEVSGYEGTVWLPDLHLCDLAAGRQIDDQLFFADQDVALELVFAGIVVGAVVARPPP